MRDTAIQVWTEMYVKLSSVKLLKIITNRISLFKSKQKRRVKSYSLTQRAFNSLRSMRWKMFTILMFEIHFFMNKVIEKYIKQY